ncbi:MAG: transporter substrate-binding domain-containing protein [Lachnospiraceae bacterium]|nr:transporter substrate-binding domain-containing protein [Lachnospiraceae bacterium]
MICENRCRCGYTGKIAGILLVVSLLMMGGLMTVHASDAKTITSKADLNSEDIRIGVGEGGFAEQTVEHEFPKAQRLYMSHIDGLQAVAQGKIDAFVFERNQLEYAIATGRTGVRLLDENMEEENHIAVGISPVSKIDHLEDKLNAFIDELKADGTLDEMHKRWVIKKDESFPDYSLPEHPEYHLTVGTTGIVPLFNYYKDNQLSGYDIELAYRFARWLNADLEFKVYDFKGIVPAAVSGDVDCIMAELNVTPERKESIPFSQDLFVEKVGIMVRDESAAAAGDGSFLDSIKESFDKNFIREERWRMFLDGILTTLLITVLSIVFGTLLGFAVFMLCRNGNPVANAITGVLNWLIRGMPLVVLLMILYYIIFGGMDISGVTVSVFAFTLTFGGAVYGLLKIGVGAVEAGQYEAAYALGYSRGRTFFRIILPQALPHVIEAYQGEVVTLVKATAIVGYIAVQDLTKAGDIVRGRTYEAFFPLIAITIIYFVLEGMLGFLVSRIRIRISSRLGRKEKILKGVRLHDPD